MSACTQSCPVLILLTHRVAVQVDIDKMCGKLDALAKLMPRDIDPLLGKKCLGSSYWARSVTLAENAIKESVQELLRGEKVLQIISNAFSDAFNQRTPMNLARFSSMQTVLYDILAARVQDCMTAAAPYLEHIMQDAVFKLLRDSGNRSAMQAYPNPILSELESATSGCVIKCVVQHVEMQSLELPSSFQLNEASETKQQRSTLRDRLQKLQAAAGKIIQFVHSGSGPFQSVPEHAASAVGSFSAKRSLHSHASGYLLFTGTLPCHHFHPLVKPHSAYASLVFASC